MPALTTTLIKEMPRTGQESAEIKALLLFRYRKELSVDGMRETQKQQTGTHKVGLTHPLDILPCVQSKDAPLSL